MNTAIANHPIVSHEEWLAARLAFLAKEKEFTRQRDELAAARRALPWERIDKEYVFVGVREGRTTVTFYFRGEPVAEWPAEVVVQVVGP